MDIYQMGLEEKLPGCRGTAQQQQISVSVCCIRISMAFSKYKIVRTTVFMHRTKGEKNTTKILFTIFRRKECTPQPSSVQLALARL
jgi:hypothetical protein